MSDKIKSLRYLLLFIALCGIFPEAYGQTKVQFGRLNLIAPLTYKDGDSDDSNYNIEDSERSASGYGLSLVFSNGFGVGFNQIKQVVEQTTTFKNYFNYVSGTEEIVDMRVLDLTFTFGKNVPFTLGWGYLLGGDVEVEYSNPLCTQFNRTSDDITGYSLLMDVGIPFGQNYNFVAGYRYTSINITFPGLSDNFPRQYSDFTLGLGYVF